MAVKSKTCQSFASKGKRSNLEDKAPFSSRLAPGRVSGQAPNPMSGVTRLSIAFADARDWLFVNGSATAGCGIGYCTTKMLCSTTSAPE
jgi:hypothetical protein